MMLEKQQSEYRTSTEYYNQCGFNYEWSGKPLECFEQKNVTT